MNNKGAKNKMDNERVELHCHSKAGGDSTAYAGEIVFAANEMGFSAIAITDTASILCFEELENVAIRGKYITRPLYGMEAIVNDEEKLYNISILVKNDQGKEVIFKLITKNTMSAERPVFKFSEVLDNRKDLLIGTGAENGNIYQMTLNGASDEDLKRAILQYDYVEVLPGEKYKAANLRIIDIADKLSKPVVAISDSHYIKEIDEVAYNILLNWKGLKSYDDKHLFTTEEMLRAFDYLPADKAFEIVISNTIMIAEQCASAAVITHDNQFPVVEDSGEILKKMCLTAVEEKYSGDNLEKAKKQLDFELAALADTRMDSVVLIELNMLQEAGIRACDISLRGACCGSIVLYLIGISDIDPIKNKLYPELAFGHAGEKLISIGYNLSPQYREKMIAAADKNEAISKVVNVGWHTYVSEGMAQEMIEKYREEETAVCPIMIGDNVRLKLCGNYIAHGRHPGVFLLPKGYNYESELPIGKDAKGEEVAYFQFCGLLNAYVEVDLFIHSYIDKLRRLVDETGVDLKDIPVNNDELIRLFTEHEGEFDYTCLPQFKNRIVQKMVEKLKPQTFDDVAKILAIMGGTDVWFSNGEKLVDKKGLDLKHIIGTREDVFEYILGLDIDRKSAYTISELVRKGIVSRARTGANWQKWKKVLLEAGADEWFIWSCEQIKYLSSRADAISRLQMEMRLAWFMIHYPKQYEMIMADTL